MNKQGQIIRQLFRSSVVSIIAATVAAMLGILIDGIIISRYLGTQSMAAYGLVNPITNFATAFSGILSTGAQVVCAQHLGAGRADKARKAFSMCMLVTIIISVVLVSLIVIFRYDICIFLGARGDSAELLPLAADYLLGMVFSLPSVLFLFEFNSLMRLDGDANRVVYAVAAMTVLDVAGDILNARVIHGGMLGMGIATTLSYAVALVIMLFHFRRKDIIFHFSLKGLELKDLGAIVSSGAPSGVGSVSAMGRSYVLNQLMLAAAASSAVAALSVVTTMSTLTGAILQGVGLTTTMIAGVIYGEQDRSGARNLLGVSARYLIGFGAALTAILLIFAPQITLLFGGEGSEEMVPLAARGMRFYALGVLLYGFNNAYVSYTQGINRLGLSNIFCFVQNFVYISLIALMLTNVFHLGTDGVWLAFPLCELATFLTLVIYTAVKKKGLPLSLSDYLSLPKNFGAAEADLYEVSLSDASQVMSASLAVRDFCERHGATPKESMLLSLFVEELGNNLTTHGFSDGKKQSVDIRVIHKEDGWTLRLRDNGTLFNPVDWLKVHESDDPTSNIGIRMVCGMAKDVQYLNTLELNNLIIRI